MLHSLQTTSWPVDYMPQTEQLPRATRGYAVLQTNKLGVLNQAAEPEGYLTEKRNIKSFPRMVASSVGHTTLLLNIKAFGADDQ
jgi:hypothetical protein